MASEVRSHIFRRKAGCWRIAGALAAVPVPGAVAMLAAVSGATTGLAQPVEEQAPVAPYRLELPSLAEELGQSDQAQPDTAPDGAAVSDHVSEKEAPSERETTEAPGTAIIDGAVEAFPLPLPDELQAPDSDMRSDEAGSDAGQLPAGQGVVRATPAPRTIEPVRNKRVLLRGLDKITGRIVPLDLPVNSPTAFGSLRITARDCHKAPPEETPEISAFLEINDVGLAGQSDLLTEGQRAVLISEEGARQVFSGWMFASSPAISALEHSVYDVWVIDCIASSPDKR